MKNVVGRHGCGMKLKDFVKELNQFDPEKDIIFSDGENYPYSFSTIDIGRLGTVDDSSLPRPALYY